MTYDGEDDDDVDEREFWDFDALSAVIQLFLWLYCGFNSLLPATTLNRDLAMLMILILMILALNEVVLLMIVMMMI